VTIGKLLIVWVSTISGLTITEWAALFAVIYTALQIVVLVRDKLWFGWRTRADERRRRSAKDRGVFFQSTDRGDL
jgi:hypothetical protein